MFRRISTLMALLAIGLVQTACSGPAVKARRVLGIIWWAWLLIIVVVALLVWWWLGRSKREPTPPARPAVRPKAAAPPPRPETAAPTPEPLEAAPSQIVETPDGLARHAAPVVSAAARPALKVEPDDLKLIEGIGPKISSLLQEAGIMTFAHLASADVNGPS